MRIFASIARPIDRITQAIDASVRTMLNDLTRAIRRSAYTIRATHAKSPAIR